MNQLDRGRTASMLRRLKDANAIQLAAVLNELLLVKLPISEDVLRAVAERLESGIAAYSPTVAKLVVKTRDRRIFMAGRQSHFSHIESLLILLRGNIPDSEVEVRLRDEFYKASKTSDLMWRKPILQALAEYGSVKCITDLEAVLFDIKPKILTAISARDAEKETNSSSAKFPQLKTLEEQMDYVRRAERDLDIEFSEMLDSAIQTISERGQQPADDWCRIDW